MRGTPHGPRDDAGAPTKCTAKVIRQVANALLLGNYLEVAAASIGVHKDTLHNWLRWGHERPRSIYRKFRDAVFEAQARYEANAVANIERAAKGTQHALLLKDENGTQLFDKDGLPLFIKPQPPDWQAEAWRLERKFANRWTKTERQEIQTNQGPAVQIVLPSNAREVSVPVIANVEQEVSDTPILPALDESESK